MDVQQAATLVQDTIWTSLSLSAPILLAALLTGLIISVFQAATQVNEQTLTFVPKIVVTLGVFAFTFPALMTTLVTFTRGIVLAVTGASSP
jgi:flagellar biosynthetic protein FliQ